MQFCISAVPEKDLKKKIDDLRFHFDRTLVREKYPYINLFGPIESYLNLKKISSDFCQFAKSKKRFRITTDIVCYMEIDRQIFLNVGDKGEMKEYYDFLCETLNLDSNPFFFPHILVASNHTPEELSNIYEELQGFTLQYSFFPESLAIYVKSDKSWEEYLTLSI